ncbi:MAG: LysM peptidoglycan-binding domain-containing protein [Nitrospirae bacterium]|nr:LysM peptidoglycan-binding domain-containing protein [Nitrospirota bacterium]
MKRFCLVAAILLVFPVYANADVTYTVKKGDTFSAISKRHKVSVKEILKLNHLRKSAKLKTGQNLIVKRTEAEKENIQPQTYTVRKGDTIYKIAKKFKMDVDELKDINLLDSDKLKKGQKLLLVAEELPAETKQIKTTKANLDEEIKNISESEELTSLDMQERLILFSKKFLNIPYKFGGSSSMGIDCSAYVQKVYSLIGINLPRSARLQFNEGEYINKDSLSIGDLVFFRTYASFPSHVGIYLGNDLFIHASSKDKKVSIDNLSAPYYLKRFIGAKRLLFEDKEDENIRPEG